VGHLPQITYEDIHKTVQPPAVTPDQVPGQPGPPILVLASSIAPGDLSTSTLLTDLTGPQIQLGRVALDSHPDIVYATPTGPDGQPLPLRLDLQVPRTEGRAPLVDAASGRIGSPCGLSSQSPSVVMPVPGSMD